MDFVSTWQIAKSAIDLHLAQKPTRSCHSLPIVMGGTLNLVSNSHTKLDTNNLPMYTSHNQVKRKVVIFLFLILGHIGQCPKKSGSKYSRLRNNLQAGQSRFGHGFQISHVIHQHHDQGKCGEEANQHCHDHDLWNAFSGLRHLFADVDNCIC